MEVSYQGGRWKAEREVVDVSHLLFANDILVFYEPSLDQLTYLSWVLMWFEAMSRLKVNLDKSWLIPMGRVENAEELSQEFFYKVGALPSIYLSLPLGISFKFAVVWDSMEERLQKRLAL